MVSLEVRFSVGWVQVSCHIITGSGVMGILFSLFRKYPRLSFDTDTKFDMNVSNKTLLNDAKCQGYSFYHFYAIKGKPTAGEGGNGLKKNPPYVGLHKCLSAVFRKRH